MNGLRSRVCPTAILTIPEAYAPAASETFSKTTPCPGTKVRIRSEETH